MLALAVSHRWASRCWSAAAICSKHQRFAGGVPGTLPGQGGHDIARLAQAKSKAGAKRSLPRSPGPVYSTLSTLALAGALGTAYYEGLWVPLLRDAQTAKEAAVAAEIADQNDRGNCSVEHGLLHRQISSDSIVAAAAARLADGAVVVVDNVLSAEELELAHRDIKILASVPGALQLNPKAQIGNCDIRTDRVCYLRDEDSSSQVMNKFTPGPGLLHCHRLLRSVAVDLEGRANQNFLVTEWTQLAMYEKNGGFYKWHHDGLAFPSMYWLLGPVGLFLYLKWGGIRRRSITAMIYLNEDNAWQPEWGGVFRCRAPVVTISPKGVHELSPTANGTCEILPHGGRLVLFDSHAVEHEVASTLHERWALTLWISR